MDKRDFFISFTSADSTIATALNDALNAAGFTTWFHPDDKPKGAGIAGWMEDALEASNQMLALCSSAYFDPDKGYSRAERQSMFMEDPTNDNALLILVKVAPCTAPRLFAQNEFIDLSGQQAPEMTTQLVNELQSEQARLARVQAHSVDRNRAHPTVFNVQGQRNPLFTGRDTELALLHDRIKSGTATAITAVQGMGGIGKTSLAREYAHRFGTSARFGGVWWIEAQTQSGILAAYDRLAVQLGNAVGRDADQEKTGEAVRDWLGQQPDSAPWLVIFDNAPNEATLAAWLPKGSAKVIITSRYDGFDTIAELLPLDFWDAETTAKYLQLRTKRGSDTEAMSLAKRLGGLPLAAEQAGAYLSKNAVLSFKAYEDRLIEMLARAPKVLPGGYDKSLYATFSTAIEAIAERPHGDAALALLNLCAFLSPDGVELELLTACARNTDILPDALRETLTDEVRCAEAVAALSAYALIRIGDTQGWGKSLILHRLLGDIARDLLDAEGHTLWSEAAVMMIRRLMPNNVSTNPSVWPLCAVLAPQATAFLTLKFGPETTGKALDYVLNQAALYLVARGDFDGATVLLKRSLEISEVLYKEDSNQLATALSNLAGCLEKRKSTLDEAETAYIRALEITEKVMPPNDPFIAITLSNMAGVPLQRKKFSEAADLIQRAAEIFKSAYGATSAQHGQAINNLSAIYNNWARETGDVKHRSKVRELLEEATQITRVQLGMRHPSMTTRQYNLSIMHADDGDTKRAAEYMALCVAIEMSLDQGAHPDTQNEFFHLLHFWTESGQADKAERLKAGDFSDLLPYVEQIEEEHRVWVAEDPDNRDFGPPSPVTGATE